MSWEYETIRFYRKLLPHWEVVGASYFITIHLRGAIPLEGMERIGRLREELRDDLPDSSIWRTRRHIFSLMEKWLESSCRNEWLRRPEVADMIVEAINHRIDQGVWDMHSYVIMPNHIHLFCRCHQSLEETLLPFKSWTGRQACSMLGEEVQNFWQQEWFDHWSRGPEQDKRITRYILNNPVKAGLVTSWEDWPYVWVSPDAKK